MNLKIHPDFITEDDERDLSLNIELAMAPLPEKDWQHRNRILRFGWDYEKPEKWVGDIPQWTLTPVWQESWFPPSNITINEYLRGQRIIPHIDSPAFGDVAILSLMSDVTLRFTSPAGETRDFILTRRSLAVMSGELRSRWTHETVPLEAEIRLSVVYRKRL